ncbi:MAG: ABC transporter ATP-binding protein [Candidatus Moduliflexus flocculans]|nr:ABC transporter ATP-binding protein [Candidatus Moduliflexus flocculans]
MLGFLVPERGEGRVLDFDIRRDRAMIRRSVGYMPESDCFVAGMDAVSFTSYFGELSGMPRREAMKRAHEVLFYVGLGEARYRLLDTYSAGMKQRLKLAQALVHDPKVLFLDEPTSNLDPTGRAEILELIRDIATNKVASRSSCPRTSSTTSSRSARRWSSSSRGGSPPRAGWPTSGPSSYSLFEIRIKGASALPSARTSRPAAAGSTRRRTGCIKVYMPEGSDRMDVFRAAARAGVQIRYFVKSRTSLEDLFADAVGVD